MKHVLHRVQHVPRGRAEIADFFETPENLGELTPEFLNFQIASKDNLEMKEGALIDYTIRLYGVPMKWRTRIEDYEPQVRFSDRQLRGPYKYWLHDHSFEDVDGGTKITDRVTYELPLGPLGSLAHQLFVKKTLETIFDFRLDYIRRRFGELSI